MLESFSPFALNQLADTLGGGGVTPAVDLSGLLSELRQLRKTAERIADAADNPTWVAGDEYCRRSALALEQGWLEDAAADATRSISAYPYRAAPHLLLALARLGSGDLVSAFDALQSAIRYGSAAEPSHAATAGLLAAELAAAVGAPESVRDILIRTGEATSNLCPEVILAQAENGLDGPSLEDVIQLMRGEPGAWLSLRDGSSVASYRGEISQCFARLVAETRLAADRAQVFFERTHQRRDLAPADGFSVFGSNYPTQLAYWEYMGGRALRHLRPLMESIERVGELTLPEMLLAGTEIVRSLGNRAYSYAHDHEELESIRFDRATCAQMAGPRLTEPAFGDVLVQDWCEVAVRVDRDNRPRGMGNTQGTGTYLKALRAIWRYERDRPAIESFLAESERTSAGAPGLMFQRKKTSDRDDHQASLRAVLHRTLETPPPRVDDLRNAVTSWIALAGPTDRRAVRPFVVAH